jgi:hypothetical protein
MDSPVRTPLPAIAEDGRRATSERSPVANFSRKVAPTLPPTLPPTLLPPPPYRESAGGLTSAWSEASEEGAHRVAEKPLGFRNRAQVAKRGGWWRVVAAAALAALCVVGLVLGLVLGLRSR